MRKYLILGLMLISCMALAAQNNNENSIGVTGRSEKEVTPDEIYLSITIDQDATKGKISVAEQEKKMIAAFKRLGIDVDKNLTVADMSSDLQSYILRKNQVQTSKTFQLKLTTPEQVDRVFEELSKLNIPNTQITKSTYSDLEGIKNELRIAAVKNAREIARTLAEACGQKAGYAISIDDNNYMAGEANYNYAPVMMARSATFDLAESVNKDMTPAVEFKKLKFTYSVNMKFILYPEQEK